MIKIIATITHAHETEEQPALQIHIIRKEACADESELANIIKGIFEIIATGNYSAVVVPDSIFEEVQNFAINLHRNKVLEEATLEPGRSPS